MDLIQKFCKYMMMKNAIKEQEVNFFMTPNEGKDKQINKRNRFSFFLSNIKGKEQTKWTCNLVCFFLAISSESFGLFFFLQALPLKAVIALLLYALLRKAANGKSQWSKCSILSLHQYFIRELHLVCSVPPAHCAWMDKQERVSSHIHNDVHQITLVFVSSCKPKPLLFLTRFPLSLAFPLSPPTQH